MIRANRLCSFLIPKLLVLCLSSFVFAADEQQVDLTIDNTSQQFTIARVHGFDMVIPVASDQVWDLSSQVGAPQLPTRVIRLPVPANAELIDYSIESIRWRELPGKYHVFPAQKPQILYVPAGSTRKIEFTQPLPLFYDQSEVYPFEPVKYAGKGTLRDASFHEFIVYPLRYLPKEKRLLQADKIRLKVTIRLGSDRSRLPEPARSFSRIIDNTMLVRPEILDLVDIISSVNNLPPRDVKYVIITSPSLVDEFEPLAAWKTKKGVPAQVVDTEWIANNYYGFDLATKIRLFIADAINDWGTEWVLLGGDTNIIPERETFAMDCEAGYYDDENELSADLYFADIQGNWDANSNGIYGEIFDFIDMYPDAHIGRAPVEGSLEASNFVQKVIAYEKANQDAYQLKMLFLADILWDDPYTDSAESKNYIDFLFVPPRFDPINKLYHSLGNESPTTVRNAINQGMNIINHCGHCFYDQMGVGAGMLYRSDMDSLNNGDKLGVLFTIGCWPAAFDYDCIAEHYLNNANGGGVAFIGNSRYGWGSPGNPLYGYSDRFDQRFFSVLFNNHIQNLGAVVSAMKSHFVPYSREANVYRWNVYQINLLGDPEMPLWTRLPRTLEVHHPTQIPTGDQNITLVVSYDNTPLKDARVCVQKSEEVYKYAHTDTAGKVILSISPLTAGQMELTVAAFDFKPYEDTIEVISSEVYLGIMQQIIQDNDGDGLINPGETVGLFVEVKNYGLESASEVSGILTCSDTNITIIQDTVNYGAVCAGCRVMPTEGFSFNIGDYLPDGYPIPLSLYLDAPDQGTFEHPLNHSVNAPILSYQEYIVDDSNGGDGDNIPDPGETVELTFVFKNKGSGSAQDLMLTVSTIDQYIDISSASSDLAAILPGEMGITLHPIVLDISADLPAGHFPLMLMTVSGQHYYSSKATRLVVGATGFYDDYEGMGVEWVHNGINDNWHKTSYRSHSPDHSFYCGSEFNRQYSNNTNASLITPEFILAPNSTLSFWRWFSVPMYGGDGLYVELTTGSGGWQTLDFIGSGGALPITGLASGWFEERYDLSNYSGAVRIRFRFYSDNWDTAEGFYIDDVAVYSQYDPQQTPTPIPSSTPTVTPTATIFISATPTRTPTTTMTPTITPDISATPTATPSETYTATPTATELPPGKPPRILIGGYMDTSFSSQGGKLNLVAFLSDNDILRVEVFYEQKPTGIYLKDDGKSGDFQAGDGIYGIEIFVAARNSTSGASYIFGIDALDSEGLYSSLWPYLSVSQ